MHLCRFKYFAVLRKQLFQEDHKTQHTHLFRSISGRGPEPVCIALAGSDEKGAGRILEQTRFGANRRSETHPALQSIPRWFWSSSADITSGSCIPCQSRQRGCPFWYFLLLRLPSAGHFWPMCSTLVLALC